MDPLQACHAYIYAADILTCITKKRMALTTARTNQSLLDAELELWNTTFGHIKSMALKSALDLRIADAIHNHGGSATVPQIVATVKLHTSKIPCFRRLMRVLAATGVLSAEKPSSGSCELVYVLTPLSRLLVGSQTLAPFTAMILNPSFVSPFFELGTWFQQELPGPCVFKHTYGLTLWEHATRDASFDALVNDAMASDCHFIMDIIFNECADAFQGISSLVDVGGGLGGAAQAISKAFPDVKCSVLDLDHVVAKAPSDTDVQYIAGDMFESVPPANAMFLKWVLHDWTDEECVKILKNCKKAIPPKEEGGKVIIIDIVVGEESSRSLKHKETLALFDLYIMLVNGIERDEEEWKKIFFEAGFSDYNISPVLGGRSIITVYP